MSILTEPSSPPRATPHAQRADSPAFLIIEQNGKKQAGPIAGRVLIGRRPANHVVIPDPSIARIHAWITVSAGRHVLFDTGSRSGTLVNDKRVARRHALDDGDTIRIGPATIHYRTDPSAIAGAQPIDLTDRPMSTDRPEDGQFVDCACGAPLWVPWDFAGKMGQCQYCGQTVIVQAKLAVVPARPRPRATPLAKPADSSPPAAQSPPKKTAICGICQSPIIQGESDHACPSCHIPFHTDCWTENRGCSSYGCAQVNVLDHSASKNGKAETPPQSAGITEEIADNIASVAPPLPWEFLILAGAVLGTVIGAWTFGLPALAAAIAAILGLRKSTHYRAALYVALPFAAIGVLAGIAISYFWYFHHPGFKR